MSQLSPSTLKARNWHGFEPGAQGSSNRHWSVLHIVVPVLVILLLVAWRDYAMAAFVGTVSATVVLVRQFSTNGRKKVDRALGVFAHWVGQFVALLLLGPVFFVGITFVRLMRKLTGSDPLRLRCAESPTFWLPSDYESRRAKFAKSMFCSERLLPGRLQLLPLFVMAILLLVVAEVGLRIYGFGDAIVYEQDPEVGYYPKPDQRVRNPGRIITINNHSMRAPDLADKKAPGHFRILMLGDSTLAGTRVANAELYSSILEKKLNEAAGTPKFEVLNMGVNAWGPLHEYAFVKKFGTFEADLAIICGPLYDCYRPLYGLETLPFFPARHPPRLALEQVAYQLLSEYRQNVLGPPQTDRSAVVATAQADQGLEAWQSMAELLQKSNAEVMFQMLPASPVTFGYPIPPGDPQSRLFEQLQGHIKSLHVYANLLGPIFKGITPEKAIYYDTVHFDRLGHRLYADYLFEQLQQHSPRVKKALEHP